MRKRNKKTFTMMKFTLTILILMILSGIGAVVVGTRVNTVNITLADGYQMTVLTNKTNVGDILKENNILVSDSEKVTPSEDETLTEDKIIVISDRSEQEIQVAKVSESGVETTLDSLLKAYDSIVEKIEVKKEEIPYKTVKKDISDGASSTKNKVLQEGKKGIKEITYKVKYQNNTEIERLKISEKIIQKPVDKIIQVRSNIVSSRASDSSRVTATSNDGSTKIFKVTAYCSCSKCCGKWANGITAMGTTAKAGRTVAASSQFSFGTKLLINGKVYTVEDRGGAIKGNRIDMYVNSHKEALRWGVKYLPVKVVK